jgi:hypothetical protein
MPNSPGLFTLKQIFSRTLTIDNTQVPSTQSNFPVLVRFSNPAFNHVSNGGHVQNVSGFDIQFFSDAPLTTKLKWEMERYNPSTGEVVAWVKIASVSSSSPTVFYMSYGDPSIVTDQSDAVNTFSNSFLGVYHLKNGTTLSVADSLNSHNGTNNGATPVAGQIDGGASFASASSQFIDIGTYVGPSAVTLSSWLNGTTFPGAYNAVVSHNSGTGQWVFFVKSNGKLECFVNASSNIVYDGTGVATLSTGTWYHVAMTYDSTSGLTGYVNAVVDKNIAANGALNTTSSATAIGKDPSLGDFFNGAIDEVRISSVARSPDWITCEYNNQQTGSTFVALGSET